MHNSERQRRMHESDSEGSIDLDALQIERDVNDHGSIASSAYVVSTGGVESSDFVRIMKLKHHAENRLDTFLLDGLAGHYQSRSRSLDGDKLLQCLLGIKRYGINLLTLIINSPLDNSWVVKLIDAIDKKSEFI